MSSYGSMTAAEAPSVARILSLCYTGSREQSAEWMAQVGHEHFRAFRDEGGVKGCLLCIAMGQWFGGKRVPIMGVAAVGVTPESRGSGTARQMMSEALGEMHQEGVPVSALYCSTQSLYRSVGYEQAGHRFEIRLPLSAIDSRERSLVVSEVSEVDQEGIEACYRGFACCFDGPLDRGPYVWHRIQKTREGVIDGFKVVGESGAIEGYFYLVLKRKPERGRQELFLTDLAFSSVRAGRRLLGLLRAYSSMADEVTFFGGPMHPALFLLAEQRFRMDLRDHWMLRIVNVASALEARGYRASPDSSVVLEVRDAILGENEGRWTLCITNGAGQVKRGGEGPVVSLDVSALAPLYSGYLSATQLQLLGRVEGSPEAIAACDAIFAGTTPWMSDGF